MYLRQPVAAALLTGAGGDLLPVAQVSFCRRAPHPAGPPCARSPVAMELTPSSVAFCTTQSMRSPREMAMPPVAAAGWIPLDCFETVGCGDHGFAVSIAAMDAPGTGPAAVKQDKAVAHLHAQHPGRCWLGPGSSSTVASARSSCPV